MNKKILKFFLVKHLDFFCKKLLPWLHKQTSSHLTSSPCVTYYEHHIITEMTLLKRGARPSFIENGKIMAEIWLQKTGNVNL